MITGWIWDPIWPPGLLIGLGIFVLCFLFYPDCLMLSRNDHSDSWPVLMIGLVNLGSNMAAVAFNWLIRFSVYISLRHFDSYLQDLLCSWLAKINRLVRLFRLHYHPKFDQKPSNSVFCRAEFSLLRTIIKKHFNRVVCISETNCITNDDFSLIID